MGYCLRYSQLPIFLIFFVMGLISCNQDEDLAPLDLQMHRRSVVDQHTRMISLQFEGGQWLSYNLETMALYKLWSGGVLWDGAAFNNVKTVQPSSYGKAYLVHPIHSFWTVARDEDEPYSIQFDSYEFLQDGQISFKYSIHQGERKIRIIENPRLFQVDDSLIFRRDFTLSGLEKDEKLIAGGVPVSDQSTIEFKYPWNYPVTAPEQSVSARGEQYWLDRSGCTTCHDPLEKNVGPSYRDIANAYVGTKEDVRRLAQRIRSGATGIWGNTVMTPHPHIDIEDLEGMVEFILTFKTGERRTLRRNAQAPIGSNPERKIKPGFGASLAGVHPAFDLIRIRPDDFKPRVGGMTFAGDGSLLVSTWDSIGGVYQLLGVEKNNPDSVEIRLIASGLSEPLGLEADGKDIYVMQKHELTRLEDRNGDGVMDIYHCVNNQFGVTPDFHEFSYGLVKREGILYGALGLAMRLMNSELQHEDRGTVFSVTNQSDFKIIARGLRQTNGIGIGPGGDLFVTENQGQWVPGCKLIHVRENHFYGCQHGTGDRFFGMKEELPAVWLPQDEIGNSPGNPIIIRDGPYVGQMVFGDVTHGGITRVFLEKRKGEYQGCAFRFSQGMEAGINRLAYGPDGGIYAGGVGMHGGWSHKEKQFGLQKLQFNGEIPFEILSVSSREDGFEVVFTKALNRSHKLDASTIIVEQWCYESTERYGGDKVDKTRLAVDRISLSDDRTSARLFLEGLREGYVVYFLFDDSLRSEDDDALWSGEVWYTLNNL